MSRFKWNNLVKFDCPNPECEQPLYRTKGAAVIRCSKCPYFITRRAFKKVTKEMTDRDILKELGI